MNRGDNTTDWSPTGLDGGGLTLEAVRTALQRTFGNTDDLALVSLRFCGKEGLLCYFTTLTSASFIMDYVIQPLAQAGDDLAGEDADALLKQVRERCLSGLSAELSGQLQVLPMKLGRGYAALFAEGARDCLLVDVKELVTRSVEEPTSQNVVRGPKEGFTESAATNMSLIRRRIRTDKLRFERYEIGEKTRTEVYLAYIEEEADEEVLRQVREQVSSCRMVSLFDSGSLESLFRPRGYWLFPTVYNSERPDSVCSCLLDKRIAVIVGGSPFVLVVPAIFRDFFQSPEDHYQWFLVGMFARVLRYVAFLLSLVVPSLYVAITSYHQELIPTILLTSIAAQREGIPFPAVVEILLMEAAFEILREAGTRMPRLVGQAISIAGALVLGEAAVQAGIVSNINVIVVALTVISSYVAPVYTFGSNIRLFRFGLILLASCTGLYGVILGCAVLMIHLSRMETFGVPYMSPFSRIIGGKTS
ncbi:spore germination protein [Paenibacillus xanthanilyticus]|uniref:Spore germination protein n=1 Tax=Paenibacillus xanthanilyticus TaxID=1783531 RepID=A0ABV8KDE8_9BACL